MEMVLRRFQWVWSFVKLIWKLEASHLVSCFISVACRFTRKRREP